MVQRTSAITASVPLSISSVAIAISARDRLVDVGERCRQELIDTGWFPRGPHDQPPWDKHPEYLRAVQAYDVIMDMIPEWREIRRHAKLNHPGRTPMYRGDLPEFIPTVS